MSKDSEDFLHLNYLNGELMWVELNIKFFRAGGMLGLYTSISLNINVCISLCKYKHVFRILIDLAMIQI